jgi:hypothetical protein
MTRNSCTKVSWGLITAWFLTSLTLSAFEVFKNNAARLGISVGVAALTPIFLFFVWFGSSAGFREFVLSLDPRMLTIAHTWRTGGFVFLVLFTFGILPGIFAIPAGAGDMLIGLTAPFVAWKLAGGADRNRFILWQSLGILDLVTAVSLGTTAQLITPHAVGMQAMTVLPLSMIPTFAVPLLIIFHAICVAQARQWPERSYSRVGRVPGSSAVADGRV